MKIFKKYIFCEVFLACAGAIALFTAILLTANVLRDMVDWIASKKISPGDTAKILLVLGPSVVSYALPIGMLAGILVVFGKMSSSNEILALKSVGISLREISRPVLVLAACCSFISACINLFYAPKSISSYRQFFRKIVQEKPMRFISAGTFNDYFPGYVIYVSDLNNGKFSGMRVWQFDDSNQLNMYIFANSGEITFDQGSNSFLLQLADGNAEKFDHESSSSQGEKVPQIIFFENINLNLPARELVKSKPGGSKKLSHMTFPELLAAKGYLNSQANKLPYQKIRHDKTLINMQISKHIAEAVGVLAMSLLAIPLGLKNNREEKSFNFVLAFALCLGYYFTMIMFSWLGDATRLRPDLLIWLPNIVLATTGGLLLKRAMEH